jgi:ribosomal protein S18 acetylase RimI-like enzyme
LDAITLESRVKQWERTFEPPHGIFVALEDQEVIGFASCGASQDDRFEAELFTLYLLKKHQGRGVGRELWNAALEFMRARGWTSFVLWVLESNATRGFYEHLGGSLVDRRVEVMHGHELSEVAYAFNLRPV